MHSMKRKLRAAGALLLALALICSLSGCLSSQEETERKAALEALDDTEKTYSTAAGTTVERQVLLDQDGVTVTLLGLTEERGERALLLAVVNASRRAVSLTAESLCVNGWLVDGYCDLYDIPSHGAQLGRITMDEDALTAAGVTELGTIDLTYTVYDADRYDDLFTRTIALETSAAGTIDPADAEPGTVLYDRGGARLSALSVEADAWNTQFSLAFFNDSSRSLRFRVDGGTVNGSDVSFYFNADVPAGARSAMRTPLYDENYDQLVLTAGDTLIFTLQLYSEDYTLLDEQEITFTPGELA